MNENKKLAYSIIMLIVGMICLSFAFVPLYNLFCKATGYGGTVKTSSLGPKYLGKRKLTIKFDANVNKNLPWKFYPSQKEIIITTGEKSLAFYVAKNLADKSVVGTAVYNVTPEKASKYFNKIACFCFELQQLGAGQIVEMPVSFFIDPEFDKDPNLVEVDEITLSYSFYLAS